MATDAELMGELDAGTYFKSHVTLNLDELRDLEGVIAKFGYEATDRIERRELVNIFRRVEREMEDEIHNSAHSGRYSNAKELRARLKALRAQFDERLGWGERIMRRDQVVSFDKARIKHEATVKRRHGEQVQALKQSLTELEHNLELTFRIEQENLEKEISRIPRPRVKFSKRVIELMKAEHQLIILQQYDDAEKVRMMLKKLIPIEEKKFNAAFDANIERMRTNLANRQASDRIRSGEKIKGIRFADIRRREAEEKRELLRVDIHKHDMLHSHSVENKLRPEMSVKPSALWTKRPGYSATASSMRGQQLQDMVNGKKKGQQVFAETLVDKHTFASGALQDTITLVRRQGDGGLYR